MRDDFGAFGAAERWRGDGEMRKRLSEMSPGERGVVFRVDGGDALCRRLMDMGIVRGAIVELVRRAPLGDPVEVKLRGYHLSLRGLEAENVHVDIAEKTSGEASVSAASMVHGVSMNGMNDENGR